MIQKMVRMGPRWSFARLIALLVILCCAASLLASCTAHSGADALAFLRDGQIWTIHADGSDPTQLAQGNIVSLAWSPDHHQMLFRYGPNASAAANAVPPISTHGAPDAVSDIATISINGGVALQLSPSEKGIARGDPWWNPDGNRLIYAEHVPDAPQSPSYVVSQADQPVGIARKPLLNDASIPVLSADGKTVAVIDPQGEILVGTPGQPLRPQATGALLHLPVTGRPAHLLWQPHHRALVYATTAPTGVSLVLLDLSGHTHTLGTTAALLDAAFSPDGSLLLVRTPQAFELWPVTGDATPVAMWPESDPLALPWWSPDSQRLLVQDATGWKLIAMSNKTERTLLTYTESAALQPQLATSPWHPAAGSPLSPDGTGMAFVAPAGSTWQGKSLVPPKQSTTGLYVATIHGDAVGAPTLIDSGADHAPTWSYLDPSTAFLVAG